MASDKVVDWEVGSLDTSGNLTVDGTVDSTKVESASILVMDSFNANSASITTSVPLIIDGTSVIFSNLPTVDPVVAGKLWSNSNVLTVSTGS